jgi:hypothetical protein
MDAKAATGKWKGSFTYGEGYGSRTGKAVEFTLELKEADGEFTGFSVDAESKDYMSEPVLIAGFLEEEMISFTKQYPYFFYATEQGELVVNKDKFHPEVIFNGEFNEAEAKYEGDWEILSASIQFGYESDSSSWTGTWEMKKIIA